MSFIDNIFQTVRIFQYTTLATISLVAYEYLIKLDVEIRYLWGRRFSLGGALIALCRYLPFMNIFQVIVNISMTDTNPARCLLGYRASSSFVFIEFLLSVFVLFARAYAVWGGSRYILAVLAIVYAGSVAGSSYAVFLFLTNTDAPPFYFSSPCLFVLGNNDLWMALAVLICCESLALGLLLIKSVQHARAMKNLSDGAPTRNILAVMAQDGIGYFACTVAITSANLVVLGRVTPDLRDFLFITQGALQNILCSRLLFHVHAVNEFPNGTIAIYSTYGDTFLRSQLGQEMELASWRREEDTELIA